MTTRRIEKDILTREPGNPILTAEDFPWKVRSAYNCFGLRAQHAGARKPYIMLCRVNERNHETLMWPADSDDGLHWQVRPEPYAVPDADWWRHATSLVYYDPRVTWIDGEYKVLLACMGDVETRVACFTSPDLESVSFSHWMNNIDAQNMVLFPERSPDGRYMRLERPNPRRGPSGGKGNIWLSFSPDLLHWGDAHEVIRIADLPLFASGGIGPSTVPLRIDEGWLIVFHTVMNNATTREYAAAAAILDADEPWKVKHMTQYPILYPVADYEMIGHVEHVCFATSLIAEDDGTVKLYYGGADLVQCVAHGRLNDLIDACRNWS